MKNKIVQKIKKSYNIIILLFVLIFLCIGVTYKFDLYQKRDTIKKEIQVHTIVPLALIYNTYPTYVYIQTIEKDNLLFYKCALAINNKVYIVMFQSTNTFIVFTNKQTAYLIIRKNNTIFPGNKNIQNIIYELYVPFGTIINNQRGNN